MVVEATQYDLLMKCSQICQVLFESFEVDYNRKGRHSALGYLSPEQYENEMLLRRMSVLDGAGQLTCQYLTDTFLESIKITCWVEHHYSVFFVRLRQTVPIRKIRECEKNFFSFCPIAINS